MKLLFLLIILSANCLHAENAIKELNLTSSTSFYQIAQPFNLNLNFKINPDWHIYYKEPGKFGLPTKMTLKSNAKLSFEEWQYPKPKEFKELTGDITRGYDDQVSFSLEVTPMESASPLELEVFVEWLSCSSEVCVPEEQTLKLILKEKVY